MFNSNPSSRTSSWISGSSSLYGTPTTEDSSSTIAYVGPGALPGKFIHGLGSLALSGIKRAQFRLADKPRLRSIRNCFPHYEAKKILEDKVYDDLIDFAIPGVYDSDMQRDALRIILVQIALRQTGQLLRRLFDMISDVRELCGLLSELVRCLPQAWHNKSCPFNVSQQYREACKPTERHPVVPFLDFLLQVAQLSALNPNILPYTIFASSPLDRLSEVCPHPMYTLLSRQYFDTQRPRHNPDTRPLSFITTEYSPNLRRNTWKAMDDHSRSKRFKEIDNCISNLPKHWDSSLVPDACMDLLSFVRTDPGFALPLIAMVFKSDFSPAWSNLAEALAIIPDAEQVLVLSSIAWFLDPKNPYARESTGEYASIVGDIFEALKGGVGAKYRFSAGNSSSALEIWRGVLDVFEKCPEVYDWRILGLSEDGIEDLDDNEETTTAPHPWLSRASIRATLVSDTGTRFYLRVKVDSSESSRHRLLPHKREWQIVKEISDIKDLEGQLRRRHRMVDPEDDDDGGGGSDQDGSRSATPTNTTTAINGMSKIWKNYKKHNWQDKEKLVQSYLNGLLQNPSPDSVDLLVEFFEMPLTEKPSSHKRTVSYPIMRKGKKGKESNRRTLSDHDDFILTANDVGLLW
ncbi:hypothetical protein VKT23_005438 [Stygiomarasmius scandens]|uniref:Uncharacterized protein n=1 Tax=Marasmiellus scandens TaxID=2682957 RepID=A0ABR1JQY3_9AGAR